MTSTFELSRCPCLFACPSLHSASGTENERSRSEGGTENDTETIGDLSKTERERIGEASVNHDARVRNVKLLHILIYVAPTALR